MTATTIQQATQARIEAQEQLDALVYGQRTLKAMGGRAWGCTAKWGAPEWAIAQWAAAVEAAAALGEDLAAGADVTQVEGVPGIGVSVGPSEVSWRLRKAVKAAREQLRAANEQVAAYGTARERRLALAA